MITGVPLVEVVRSGVVESLHRGHLVAIDGAGRIVAALGDVVQPVFPRSSNKPLQAVGMRRLGLDVPSAPAGAGRGVAFWRAQAR